MFSRFCFQQSRQTAESDRRLAGIASTSGTLSAVNSLSHNADGRATITRNLERFDARCINDTSLKHAAVCLILADDGAGDCALVITLRASHLNTHAGQFALPGGRVA